MSHKPFGDTLKVMFVGLHEYTDSERKNLEDDGWELQYLLKPSDCPLLEINKEKIV